jgi:ribonucleoside-diphosphate reductase alpha chain
VAHVLNDYLEQWNEREEGGEASNGEAKLNGNGHETEMVPGIVIEMPSVEPVVQPPLFKVGDLCPECGQAAVVNEEGCRKCYSCGYSEC